MTHSTYLRYLTSATRYAVALAVTATGLVAQATTEWVFASNQGRPRRIPNEVVGQFRAGR